MAAFALGVFTGVVAGLAVLGALDRRRRHRLAPPDTRAALREIWRPPPGRGWH